MGLIIFGHPDFARLLADRIPNATFIAIEERIFPDGEICPRLVFSNENQISESHVVVVVQLGADQNKNDYLISLLWTIYNIKQYNPARISCIFPYHIYSRQDRETRRGDPISIQYLAEMLESAGIDDFLTINSHIFGKSDIQKIFTHSKAYDISAIPILIKGLQNHLSLKGEELICLSPDVGAISLAYAAATAIRSPFHGAIHKERDPNTGEVTQTISKLNLEIKGKNIVVVDDLVSSGGTMIGAAKLLKQQGAKQVFFAYVHAVHSPSNFQKLLAVNSGGIFSTDTIRCNMEGLTTISIIPLLAEWIQKLHSWMN
ncbi:ribose-phosphate diphosphokinase [Candidatus Hodarchaeum mangrovi]